MSFYLFGRIYDMNIRGVRNSNVTLWIADNNGELIKPVQMPENPSMSSDGRINEPGIYKFPVVEPGRYVLTAEKNGKVSKRNIQVVDCDVINADLIMKDYSDYEVVNIERLPNGVQLGYVEGWKGNPVQIAIITPDSPVIHDPDIGKRVDAEAASNFKKLVEDEIKMKKK